MNENKTKPEWEDYGESSLTLLSVLVGMKKKSPQIPYDPSDFRRCVHLFECLDLRDNEIYDLLNETANQYPEWQPFTDHWTVLMDLYLEEKDKDFANKLYQEMMKLRTLNSTQAPKKKESHNNDFKKPHIKTCINSEHYPGDYRHGRDPADDNC